MEETVTAAHCTRCSRTGHLTPHDAGYWCAWCGEACEIELREVEVVIRGSADWIVTDGRLVDPENLPLQPLRITAGWKVAYNGGLYQVDPTPGTVKWWWIFKQDMLMLVHEERNRLLDVCWTPEMDFEEGAYRLSVYEGDFRGRELLYWSTRDRAELVHEIERILERVTNGAPLERKRR